MTELDPQRQNIIVIGASAGGLEPLRILFKDLPPDLPAAIFVVLHVGTSSHLAEILSRSSSLPVSTAANGAPIAAGQIFIAPSGFHLLLHDEHLMLRRGPRENFARPAIDPLFRSAACTFGGRVIGIVLSGTLSDGTAGLRAVQDCGGISIVQDPDDAQFPDMPRNAMRETDVDYCLPIEEMAALLAQLVVLPARPSVAVSKKLRLETAIAAMQSSEIVSESEIGSPSPLSCPECHGPLWQIDDGHALRFRCNVGHAYSAAAAASAKTDEVERLLWTMLRANVERGELARRMSSEEQRYERFSLSEQLKRRAREYDEDAEHVRRMIEDLRNEALGPTPESNAGPM